MSTLKKDHVLGAGGSAVAGGTVGAVVGGLVGGPAGAALGAIAGTAAAAVTGHKTAEALDSRGDIGHFQQIYQTMPYYISDMEWSDYEPAYRLGLDSHGSDRNLATMEADWSRDAHGSRLVWSEVLPVIEHTWRELEDSSVR